MLVLQWVKEMCDKVGEAEKLHARIRELEDRLEKSEEERISLGMKLDRLEEKVTFLGS